MVLSPWEGLGWKACQSWPPHSQALAICANDVSARGCVMRMELIIHIIHTRVGYITLGTEVISDLS